MEENKTESKGGEQVLGLIVIIALACGTAYLVSRTAKSIHCQWRPQTEICK